MHLGLPFRLSGRGIRFQAINAKVEKRKVSVNTSQCTCSHRPSSCKIAMGPEVSKKRAEKEITTNVHVSPFGTKRTRPKLPPISMDSSAGEAAAASSVEKFVFACDSKREGQDSPKQPGRAFSGASSAPSSCLLRCPLFGTRLVLRRLAGGSASSAASSQWI
jgi:hypothetical protein